MKAEPKNQTPKAAAKLKDLKPASNPKGGATSGTTISDFHFTKQTDKSSPTI